MFSELDFGVFLASSLTAQPCCHTLALKSRPLGKNKTKNSWVDGLHGVVERLTVASSSVRKNHHSLTRAEHAGVKTLNFVRKFFLAPSTTKF